MSLITALKSIGNDFVFGFIQAMDGEKVSREVFILGNCEEEKKPVGRLSAICRPTVGPQTADRFYPKYRLPVGRQSVFSRFSLDTISNMCNTLTIDFQNLVAPKGAVL